LKNNNIVITIKLLQIIYLLTKYSYLNNELKKLCIIDYLEYEVQHYTGKGALMNEHSGISKTSAINRQCQDR